MLTKRSRGNIKFLINEILLSTIRNRIKYSTPHHRQFYIHTRPISQTELYHYLVIFSFPNQTNKYIAYSFLPYLFGEGVDNFLWWLAGTPPTDDGTTLVGRELDIIGGGLVSDVSTGQSTGGDTHTDDRVRGDITQPNRLVVNLINNILRIHATTSDTVVLSKNYLSKKWNCVENGKERPVGQNS